MKLGVLWLYVTFRIIIITVDLQPSTVVYCDQYMYMNIWAFIFHIYAFKQLTCFANLLYKAFDGNSEFSMINSAVAYG